MNKIPKIPLSIMYKYTPFPVLYICNQGKTQCYMIKSILISRALYEDTLNFFEELWLR